MKRKFIIIQPEGIMPLYHFMQLSEKIKAKIFSDKMSGTYTIPGMPEILNAVQEQLTILYN